MSTQSEKSAIVEIIKMLFKKLFGMGGPSGPDEKNNDPNKEKNAQDKFGKMSEILDAEIADAKEKDDFVKAMMLERQKCCIDALKETIELVSNGEIEPKSQEELYQYAADLSESKVNEIMSTEEFKDGLADYHNHDPELINEKAKEVNGIITSASREIDFGHQVNNTLNSLMRQENTHAIDFLNRPPESHAQEIGQEPTHEEVLNEKDDVLKKQKEFNNEYYSDPKNNIGTGYSS